MTELIAPLVPNVSAQEQLQSPKVPLVVDLDGSLVHTDLLYESFFASIKDGAAHHWKTLKALLRGKAPLKAYLAQVSKIDYARLPINSQVVELIRQAKSQGRLIYLATASNRYHAESIAANLGYFDGVFSSDDIVNMAAENKARTLVEAFGDCGFDYVGNSTDDIAIWQHARTAYVVSRSRSLQRKLESKGLTAEVVDTPPRTLRVWIRALRVHQYAKNVLIFVALLTSHAYTATNILHAILGFIAFSLCASSAYFLNDLIDLNADRQHPSKQRRPFASGAIPIMHGVAAIPILVLLAFGCAALTTLEFAVALLVYFSLTLAYSFTLKRRLIVDIVVLATLYTTRVVAGAAALPVMPSEWLLAFSMFIFTSLALMKRYIELAMRVDQELPDPSNRNYRLIDLPIVGALAAASGFNAVTIFALYVSSPAVATLYRHPELLWLLCPVLMYWLSRMVVLAHRRVIDDDPIVFALRDRNSRICAAAMVAIVLIAS
jgi:4-hydroxybenzoate polyprenyltransferase/phosphoserine phosphatase